MSDLTRVYSDYYYHHCVHHPGQTLVHAIKRTENLTLHYELSSLTATDSFTPNSLYPVIIGGSDSKDSQAGGSGSGSLLSLDLDVKPLDGLADMRVGM